MQRARAALLAAAIETIIEYTSERVRASAPGVINKTECVRVGNICAIIINGSHHAHRANSRERFTIECVRACVRARSPLKGSENRRRRNAQNDGHRRRQTRQPTERGKSKLVNVCATAAAAAAAAATAQV